MGTSQTRPCCGLRMQMLRAALLVCCWCAGQVSHAAAQDSQSDGATASVPAVTHTETVAEPDPFAYQAPPPRSHVRVRFGAGLGVGIHASEAPTRRSLREVSSDPFLMATAFASLESHGVDGIGLGLHLSYRSSIGQTGSVSAPPVDQMPFNAEQASVESPVRKQEVVIDGLLRFDLEEVDEGISLPLRVGMGFLGFNTDLDTPMLEYTVFDLHAQPSVRIPVGILEFEVGALGGLGWSVDSGLEDAGYETLGFLYGGQATIHIIAIEPLRFFADARFRQTLFGAEDGSGSFIDTLLAISLGAAMLF